MNRSISRREFLKFAPFVPLALGNLPRIFPAEDETSQFPNVLILIFDTFSALHSSLYGYPRHTTPHLVRAAERGIVFHNHYAAGNFTTPGTASLLTGTNPWTHRAFHMNSSVQEAFVPQNLFGLFAATHHTFAYSHNPFVNMLLTQFRRDIHDYIPPHELEEFTIRPSDRYPLLDYEGMSNAEALIFFRQDLPTSSLILSRFLRAYHLNRESELNKAYEEQFPKSFPNSVHSYFTLEDSVDWLIRQATQRPSPYLGYVHLLPPHYPYTPRKDFIGAFQDQFEPPEKPKSAFTEGRDRTLLTVQRQSYDEFLAYVDAEFGRLFDALDQSGALQNTILVLTSDHGELFERGIWMHSNPTLYQPLIRVPLVIWTPEQNRRTDVHHLTSCIDLIPTLLELTGKSQPAWLEGQVILPPVYAGQDRSIFSMELSRNAKLGKILKGSLSIVRENFKLMRYTGYDGIDDFSELYDLASDPGELRNLIGAAPAMARILSDELDAQLQRINQA